MWHYFASNKNVSYPITTQYQNQPIQHCQIYCTKHWRFWCHLCTYNFLCKPSIQSFQTITHNISHCHFSVSHVLNALYIHLIQWVQIHIFECYIQIATVDILTNLRFLTKCSSFMHIFEIPKKKLRNLLEMSFVRVGLTQIIFECVFWSFMVKIAPILR